MCRSVLLLFVYFFVVKGYGQNIEALQKKADSLIISTVGERVFKEHYTLDTIGEYSRDTNQVKTYVVGYIFYVKKYEKPYIRTGLLFDENFHPKFPPNVSFIPDFVLKGIKKSMLSKEGAYAIAKGKFKKTGIRYDDRIYFDEKAKAYIWEVMNVLEDSPRLKRYEKVLINAETSVVLDFIGTGSILKGAVYQEQTFSQ
jgi:hypothetical protein